MELIALLDCAYRQGTGVVRARYGVPVPVSLAFCTSQADVEDGRCGALALRQSGMGDAIFSAGGLVLQSPLACTDSGRCQACTPSAAMQGTCGPGWYLLKYQAYDEAGQVGTTEQWLLCCPS